MISTRYAAAVSVILGIALVPTAIHSYLGAMDDDGRSTKEIAMDFGEYTSADTRRRPEWVADTYDSSNWIERIYTSKNGAEVRLLVARSYNLKRLYHHPELGVLHGKDLSRAQTAHLGESNIPVHVLRANTGKGIAAYALLYDDDFVTQPIKLQLRTALEQLVSARKPMTLFLAYEPNVKPDDEIDQTNVARILIHAIKSFRSQDPNGSRE